MVPVAVLRAESRGLLAAGVDAVDGVPMVLSSNCSLGGFHGRFQ